MIFCTGWTYFWQFRWNIFAQIRKKLHQNPKKVTNKKTRSEKFWQNFFWSGKRQLRKQCRKKFSFQVRKKLNVKSLYSKTFSCKMTFWQIEWMFDKLVKKLLPKVQNFVSPIQGKLLPSVFYPKQVQLKFVSDQWKVIFITSPNIILSKPQYFSPEVYKKLKFKTFSQNDPPKMFHWSRKEQFGEHCRKTFPKLRKNFAPNPKIYWGKHINRIILCIRKMSFWEHFPKNFAHRTKILFSMSKNHQFLRRNLNCPTANVDCSSDESVGNSRSNTEQNCHSMLETTFYSKFYKKLPNCSSWQTECSFENIDESFLLGVEKSFAQSQKAYFIFTIYFETLPSNCSSGHVEEIFEETAQTFTVAVQRFSFESQKLQLKVPTKRTMFWQKNATKCFLRTQIVALRTMR